MPDNVTPLRAPAPPLPSIPFPSGTTPASIHALLDEVTEAHARLGKVIERLKPVIAEEIAKLSDEEVFDHAACERPGSWLMKLNDRFVLPLYNTSVLSRDWVSEWTGVQAAVLDLGDLLVDWQVVAERMRSFGDWEAEEEEALLFLVGNLADQEEKRRLGLRASREC